jgi:transcriptional regulator with XRE-family HTH domain
MAKTFGQNAIRELRKKLGLTARNLAERVGTTEATISRIESGKQNLTQTWLQKISQALGVTIIELLSADSRIGADYVPVVGSIENGAWIADQKCFNEQDRIYRIPVVGGNKDKLALSAFEYIDGFANWIIAEKMSKLKAANYIGKLFVVLCFGEDEKSELSLRVLEHREQGLYLVYEGSQSSPKAVRLDDDSVVEVWRVVLKYVAY